MRLFMRNASEDKPFVQALQAALPAHVRVWLDVENLYAGHSLSDELRRAVLDENDYLVLFVSPHSLQSDWVAQEMRWALEREADLLRPFVVPVFLSGTTEEPPAGSQFAPLWKRTYLKCPCVPPTHDPPIAPTKGSSASRPPPQATSSPDTATARPSERIFISCSCLP